MLENTTGTDTPMKERASILIYHQPNWHLMFALKITVSKKMQNERWCSFYKHDKGVMA